MVRVGNREALLLVFLATILLVVLLIHLYLWKRLIRDPFRPGWQRRTGAVVAALLAMLVPATLIGTRTGHAQWLAWPGYLWIALMFYLLVTLAVTEPVRAVLLLSWRWRTRTRGGAGETPSETRPATPSANRPQATSEDRADTPTANHAPTADHADTPTASHANAPTADHADTPTASRAATTNGDGVSRRLLLARGTAIFAGLTAASVTGYGVRTALGPPQLQRVQLPMAKLPRRMDGLRLAVVSDIHLGPLTGTHHVGRIVNAINSVSADIVCIVGDMVDGTVAELGRFAAPLASVESRRGAFFVTGNHEYYSGFAPWVDEVARLGVRPLRNARVEIDGLDLAGVNDLSGVGFGDGPDFAQALGDRDAGRPVVLMAHQPAAVHQAAPFGVDLQVSGHTHGGQMAPFNLVVRTQQPIVSGFGQVNGVPVFVTNGAGFWGPPVRVGAPPQVTVIDLRTA